MERTEFLTRLDNAVNAALARCESVETIIDTLHKIDHAGQEVLFDQYLSNLHSAISPEHFREFRIKQADARMEQGYELLRNTFAPSVLSPRERYVRRYSVVPDQPRSSVWLTRIFEVSGHARYDTDGNLCQFTFDPLHFSTNIAASISGSLMEIEEQPGRAIAGIGYLATRPAMRKHGHGRALIKAFEEAITALASLRGLALEMLILEAENRARTFWGNCGFLTPANSVYMQPPIMFDQDTGDPVSETVTEMIMVKPLKAAIPGTIPRDLLDAVMHTVYFGWYGGGSNPQAQAKIGAYIEGLHHAFMESVASWGDEIPLSQPSIVNE
jgi:GNAT superfamily N-acetyltransferase